MSKRDYYEILGVDRNADAQQLKSAYRKLALQHHPDRNPGNAEASEKFKEASEAYAVLSDPDKRARYERFGHAGVGSAGAGGFGFDPSIFADFSDLFGEFFGFGNSGSSRVMVGSDLVYRMELSFHDAAFGIEAPLAISRLERCEDCGGSGGAKGSLPRTCAECGGRGRLRFSQGFLSVTRPCPACGGDGRVIEKRCPACQGEGRKRATRKLEIRVPAGVETGSRLRLAGEGDVGPAGGPPGDLYVVITVLAHESFEREGDDIVLRVDLPFPTLVLGGEVSVPTLEQEEKIVVAPGTQPGAEIRLRGRGFGRIGRRNRGDFVVRVNVAVPSSPSAKEKDLLRQYAQVVGAPVSKPTVVDKAKKIFK